VADDLGCNIYTMKFLLHNLFKLDEEVVTYTSDGLKALSACRQSYEEAMPYSLMILDYNMPKLTGLEVMQACDDLR